jgi:hypothetical protein
MEEELLAAAKSEDEETRRATREFVARISENSESKSADELALNLAANLEGAISLIFHSAFVKALEESDARTRFDADKLEVSFWVNPRETAAHARHFTDFVLGTQLRVNAEALARFPPPPQLQGRYRLAFLNECPTSAGNYELVQRGRLLELRDNEDNILMYGAIGASRAFLVPNDQRYAAIERRDGIIVDVHAPDTNADIIQASLAPAQPGTITLHGMPSDRCRGELRPSEIVS